MSRTDSTDFLSGYQKRAVEAELVAGRVITRGEDPLGHNMLRGNVFFAFKNALQNAKFDLNLYTFGALVRINDQTVRIPDSIVQTAGYGRARLVDAPLIVTDIKFDHLSKGEMQQRFEDYFSVDTIQHYLVVDPDKRIVFHHERTTGNKILSHIVRADNIVFGEQDFAVSYLSILGEVNT